MIEVKQEGNTIIIKARCDACRGSGLYQGLAERDGLYVACHVCKGTGCHERRIEAEPFTGREVRPGVKRVISRGSMFVLDPSLLGDEAGLSYDDWLDGKPFAPGTEPRRWSCPLYEYRGSEHDVSDRGGQYRWCISKPNLGHSIPQCQNWSRKDLCWSKFDADFEDASPGST